MSDPIEALLDAVFLDAVFLDVGGVLHLPDHQVVLAGLAAVGLEVDPGCLDRCHYAGAAALRLPDERPFDETIWRTYQEGYAASLGIAERLIPRAVAALSVVFARPGVWSRLIPGTCPALAELAATGVALAIVSNSDGTLEGRLRKEGLCQVGDGPGVEVRVVVDSGCVGVSKPDPAIFDFAFAATGVPPQRTVHVGDAPAMDIEGARAAGVQPWHLDPYGFCADDSHPHFQSLAEVAGEVARVRREASPA
ncbi:MAG: HAD family hydrolase [Acidimicrobiia bacterium]